jgi:DNA-binding winged helix-turn-helix (wHTH) protein/tetratricopeptide (TPR) repeat protein
MCAERYRVLDLDVDADDASVVRDGERIALPPLTFELLLLLVRRHPHLVRRQEILDAVWPREHVSDQTLTHRVLLLRQALGDRTEAPRYVAGERGFGYRLLAPVARLPEAPYSPDERPHRARLALSALGVALAAALLTRPVALSRETGESRVTVAPLSDAGLPEPIRSVAGDLSAALRARLARTPGVRVGRDDETPGGLVLEGDVRTRAERLEVALRLREGPGGAVVWTRTARGKAYEVLSESDALLAAAADAVARQVGRGPGAGAPRPEEDPRVRRLCLRGEFHWLAWDAESFDAARRAHEEALALDPGGATAHAGLALAACGLAMDGDGRASESVAKAHAARAREIDPREPSALLASGLVRLLFDWDATAAVADCRQALDAAPEELTSRMGLALALQAAGRFEESAGLLLASPPVEPDAGALYLAGRGLAASGRCAEAVPLLRRALASNPRLRGARTEIAACLPSGPERADAAALCRDRGPATERARACTAAGDVEGADAALRAAVDAREPAAVLLRHDPLLRPLSRRPGILAALERIAPAAD